MKPSGDPVRLIVRWVAGHAWQVPPLPRGALCGSSGLSVVRARSAAVVLAAARRCHAPIVGSAREARPDDSRHRVPVSRVSERVPAKLGTRGGGYALQTCGDGVPNGHVVRRCPHASARSSRVKVGAPSPGPGSPLMRPSAVTRPTSRRSRLSSAFNASSSARGMLTSSDASALMRDSSVPTPTLKSRTFTLREGSMPPRPGVAPRTPPRAWAV
jgi:hypothetical protein